MKKYILIILILAIAFNMAACSDSNTTEEDSKEKDQETIVEKGEDIVDEDLDQESDEKSDEAKVNLFFANLEYVETGDDTLDHFIIQEKTLNYEGMTIEEAIVKELMKDPKDDSMTTEIPYTAKLLGVEVTDGTAFVNFAQEGMSGGSTQEYLTINQIVNSLLELADIDRVQFLIDGEKVESLMGHCEIMEPFEK